MQLPADKPLSGASLFHVESPWTTQDGREIRLASLSGSPLVLAMVYTHCEQACPRIVSDMKAIEKMLTPEERAKTRFVLASIDPERDTVQRLSAFAKQASLEAPRWVLVRAEDGAVRELTAVLGVKYRPEPPKDFAHSNLITVVDGEGVILHQQEGLGASPDASVNALRSQLRK
jgi:protein SCO1/2